MTTPTISWHVKLPALLGFFAVAPLVLLAWWTLDLLERSYETATFEGLEALARAKAEALEQFTDDRKTEVERIAQLLVPQVARIQEAERLRARAGLAEEDGPLPELQDAEALPLPEGEDAQAEPSTPSEDDGKADAPSNVSTGDREHEAPARHAARERAVEEAIALVRQQLGLMLWDQEKFEELLVIDADGTVLVSTFNDHEDKTAAELAYFQNGLGATYVQPVFLSPITGRLTMVIATPMRDESAAVVGVLAARLNLRGFFRLVNDAVGLGRTGETVVGKLIGDSVVLMAPTRHDPDAALKARVARGSPFGHPLQQATRGEQGSGRVLDYRGACVYAAWEHVPSLEWALAVKVGCAEATTPLVEVRNRMIPLALGILALALLAAFLVARALVRPLNALKRAADDISRGDLDVRLNINSSDEIGQLASSFERMVAAIKFFREHSRRDEEDEMELQQTQAPSSGRMGAVSESKLPVADGARAKRRKDEDPAD